MREILFRGKWKNTGEWVGGFPVETVEGNFYIANTAEELGCGICIQETECYGNYEVIPETVGQYTGLKDKNGKRIFEGDIIKYDNQMSPPSLGHICFGNYEWNGYQNVGFYVKWDIDVIPDLLRTDLGFWTSEGEIEVLGNRHDNPELLEVRQ